MKTLINNKTGQVYHFIRTSEDTYGALLEMEVIYPAHSHMPPKHYHPYQTEHFKILKGEMIVSVNDEIKLVKAGEEFTLLPGSVHSMWNHSNQAATLNWIISPALQSEQFFETMVALANEGHTDEKGIPNLLQIGQTFLFFSKEFRLIIPYQWIQKLVFSILSWIATSLGYHAVHRIDK